MHLRVLYVLLRVLVSHTYVWQLEICTLYVLIIRNFI